MTSKPSDSDKNEISKQCCCCRGGDFPGSVLQSQFIFWCLVTVCVALDLWSKAAVFKWLSGGPEPSYSIIDGLLRLVVTENPGAAFGVAAGYRGILIVISIIALLVILAINIFGCITQKLMRIALAFFTAGIIGNLYDRIFNNGLVRDFIDVYYGQWHWPAFNVADSLLCIAVGLILICNFFAKPNEKPNQ